MNQILHEMQGSWGQKSINASPTIPATSDPAWKKTKDTMNWKGNEKGP